ncbi:hypothetical protein MJO28_004379 [Puccinia striiformis f. sp. tritici]|uniref:Uncharacterized protein n=1 Tax=Puccinia striiformis f. sp. tritici TaxID=168172 RepID=A0ACC0ER35_9BASI|nr:hypothetical protein MJO28_004379 [Puccinia striiformis f. sp. tritici]
MKTTRSGKPISSRSEESDSSSTNGALEREEMLKALASQTLAQFQIDGLSSPSDDEDDEDDEDDGEEWGGIQSDSEADDENFSVAGTDEDFDGPEDLLQESTSRPLQASTSAQQSKKEEPEIIVFNDPSRSVISNIERDLSQQERNSFMASTLRKQTRTELDSSDRKGKRKNVNDEEAKLAQLDRSLSNLVSHLSGPKKTQTIELDTILSSTLPPLTRDKNPQRHPRSIKTGIARAELSRSLAADKEALISGTVRASNAKTTTKRQKRAIDGTADRERRNRKTQTDSIPIGKSGGGGLIKLSSYDIRSTTSANRNSFRPVGKSSRGRR